MDECKPLVVGSPLGAAAPPQPSVFGASRADIFSPGTSQRADAAAAKVGPTVCTQTTALHTVMSPKREHSIR